MFQHPNQIVHGMSLLKQVLPFPGEWVELENSGKARPGSGCRPDATLVSYLFPPQGTFAELPVYTGSAVTLVITFQVYLCDMF